ncbi:MAG TPA: hypothetical protein VJ999_01290 [Candidatus Sulfotelmatobacter sp.]|nr:hypothetical protein [Candidatus Sulfotelmatobacter sp.]
MADKVCPKCKEPMKLDGVGFFQYGGLGIVSGKNKPQVDVYYCKCGYVELWHHLLASGGESPLST